MSIKKATLTEDGRTARKEYLRQWRRANRDKCREYQERHWNKVAERAGNGNDQDKKPNKTEE